MAINPLLSLQVRSVDISNLSSGPSAAFVEKKAQEREDVRLDTEAARVRKADIRAERADVRSTTAAESAEDLKQLQIINQGIDTGSKREKARIESTVFGSQELDPLLAANDLEGAERVLMARRAKLGERITAGEEVDTADTDIALEAIRSGNPEQIAELKRSTEQLIKIGVSRGLIEAPAKPDVQNFTKDGQTIAVDLTSAGAGAQINDLISKGFIEEKTGGQTINVGTGVGGEERFPGEADFLEADRKEIAKEFKTKREDVKRLKSTNRSLSTSIRLIENNPDIQTGLGSRAFNKAKTVAIQMGLLDKESAKTVADFNALESRIQDQTLEKTELLKGAISDKEGERAEIAAGTLSASRDGLLNQMRLAQKLNEIEIAFEEGQMRWFREGGTFDGYTEAFRNDPNRPSIDDLALFAPTNEDDEDALAGGFTQQQAARRKALLDKQGEQ